VWATDLFIVFVAFTFSHSVISKAPRSPRASKQHKYYSLWKYVTKLKQMGGGGSCEWRCNLCENVKTYKDYYTRVKAHFLHEGVKGVDVCAHTRNPEVRATFQKEHNDAQNHNF
jgi:hypothetical protein